MLIRQYVLHLNKSFCVRRDYQKDIYVEIFNFTGYDYNNSRTVYCNTLKTFPDKIIEKYHKFRMYYTLYCAEQTPIRKIELKYHEW